jgi:hypothetical protein
MEVVGGAGTSVLMVPDVVLGGTGDFLASAEDCVFVVRGREGIDSAGVVTVTGAGGATADVSRVTESVLAPPERQAITTTTETSIAYSLIIFS